jgi:hypothetical protein
MPADTTFTAQPGQTLSVKIVKTPAREAARKTLERLFMRDGEYRAPIDARAARHTDRPKRRGGRIYTKYTRKVHPTLEVGHTAKIPATSQYVRDLRSVGEFVEVH